MSDDAQPPRWICVFCGANSGSRSVYLDTARALGEAMAAKGINLVYGGSGLGIMAAVANAEHNHELIAEDLFIKAVHADEGPTIKRYRPRALGRATRIRKRTSHLTILLTPKP